MDGRMACLVCLFGLEFGEVLCVMFSVFIGP